MAMCTVEVTGPSLEHDDIKPCGSSLVCHVVLCAHNFGEMLKLKLEIHQVFHTFVYGSSYRNLGHEVVEEPSEQQG